MHSTAAYEQANSMHAVLVQTNGISRLARVRMLDSARPAREVDNESEVVLAFSRCRPAAWHPRMTDTAPPAARHRPFASRIETFVPLCAFSARERHHLRVWSPWCLHSYFRVKLAPNRPNLNVPLRQNCSCKRSPLWHVSSHRIAGSDHANDRTSLR